MNLPPGHLQVAFDSPPSESSTELPHVPPSRSKGSLVINPPLPPWPELATDGKSPRILSPTKSSVRTDSLDYTKKFPSFIRPASVPLSSIAELHNDSNLSPRAKCLARADVLDYTKSIDGSIRTTQIPPASSPSSLSSSVFHDDMTTNLLPPLGPEAESKHIPEPELEPEPQFHISISASFSASKITYTRSIPSNTHHPCEPLPRLKKSALESDVTLQIMSLISRKRQENLAFAAQSPTAMMEKEYRLYFSINTSFGTGDLHSFLGLQPASHPLCAVEAREIIASLETIVARQLSIVDPLHRIPDGHATQPPDPRPKMLTLRFDICDADQSILLSCLITSKTAPTYPLPPAAQTRELMQRLWERTSAVMDKQRPGRIDRVREKVKGFGKPFNGQMFYGLCVSFEVLFGDAEHKWFGGLCYGDRKKPFGEAGELEALGREVERVFKGELERFEKLREMGWAGDGGTQGGEKAKVERGARWNARFSRARRSLVGR